MRTITILEFPTNLGLKEPSPGKEPGVRKLPSWLRQHGFHDSIPHDRVIALEPPPYSMHLDETSGVRNADAIVSYARSQATVAAEVIRSKNFSLAIGGDCSILIGQALALKKLGRYGLFFFDGHTDFMLPELSASKAAAGMDLAIVTGYGHAKLTDIDGRKPYFRETHVYSVGNREYDPDYVSAIADTYIAYQDLKSLEIQGGGRIANEFLQMAVEEKLDGFWIHLDVDVLHNTLMPAVDSPDPGGVSYEIFHETLLPLLQDPRAVGMDITILDPDLDPEGNITRRFVGEFSRLINSAFHS